MRLVSKQKLAHQVLAMGIIEVMIVVVTGLRNQIDGGVGNGVFSSIWTMEEERSRAEQMYLVCFARKIYCVDCRVLLPVY